MPLRGLDVIHPSEPTVPVHYEGDMSGNRTLLSSADKELAELEEDPFDRRAVHKPFPRAGCAQFGGHRGTGWLGAFKVR